VGKEALEAMLTVPLRGRAREMEALTALLARLRRGGGAVLVIEGSPGLGKSRLLAELARAAAAEGALVAAGRADEIEDIAPLSPLLAALSDGDPPVLRGSELVALERPGDQRYWLLEELGELLELRSRDAPILVALDDMQWADPVTTWAVRLLSQRLASSPIGWVLATRAQVARPMVAALVATLMTNGATLVQLQPLAANDMASIAADLLGGAPDAELNDFLGGVGGNPFLGVDLLQALVAEDAISITRGVASLEERRVPDRFRASVRGRLTTLSRNALHFVQAGSVFGRSFRLADIAAMLGSWSSALVPVVDEAVRANVLVDVGAHLEFCHDLIRQAISHDMSDSTRIALHRGAAAAILTRGGSATEAATHLLASAEPGDDQAIAVLQDAAAEIAGQAPRTAAELALHALDLMAPGRPGWVESLVSAVRMTAWASRFAEATSLAERALALDLDTKAVAEVRLGLADALMLGGRRRDVIAQCREALAMTDLPASVRSALLHNLGFALGMNGEVTAAAGAYTKAIDAAEGDDPLILACRIGLAFVAGSRGLLADGLAMGEACTRAAEAGGPEQRQRFPQAWLATALSSVDRFEDAEEVLVRYRGDAEELGASWAIEFCQRGVCVARMKAGRLNDAETEAEANLALIDALDMWHDSDVPFGVLALVAIHRNDLEQARAHLSRARQYEAIYARALPPYLALASALMHDAEGDREGAIAAMREICDLPELRLQNLAIEAPLAPVLVRLAMRARDHERADAVCRTADELAALNPNTDLVLAAAAQCRGLRRNSPDDLLEAADRFNRSPRVIARASAAEDAGRALIAAGDAKRGVGLLNEALELYREAGATHDELRVRSRLREAGVRLPSPKIVHASRERRGWEGLTSAELRVVRLVAQGLTNREVAERLYVSSYTVGTHLKHAFEKVGVSSRVDLTRLAMERGPA
jgi:DNA-binding CsgD family transcriptional regulator/tetratricopeptide (TPR) repeat protein